MTESNYSRRVVVVSVDSQVHAMCREVVVSLGGASSHLIEGTPEDSFHPQDLRVWDFNPEHSLRPPPAQGLVSFLVAPKDLEQFRAWVAGNTRPNLLLKPVIPATLRAFLEPFFSLPTSAAMPDPLSPDPHQDHDELVRYLTQTNLKLQQYDHERTNFLARTLHDFRSPVSALTGYFALFLAGQLGPLSKEQIEVLERMRNSAKRLSCMTNSMFLLSTRRNVSFPLNSEQDDIAECVKQSTHEMLPACIRKHLTVSTDLEPCPASLDFERSQIEQVLVNLLENSTKFAPAHSSIEIRGYPDFWERRVVSPSIGRKPERRQRPEPGPNCYRIDVCDDGPGVEPQMLHTLFEEYSSSAEGFNRCGSGLGLAICKAIMERHNGRIWVTPSAKGAVFSLALPLTPTRAVPLECTHGAHEETPQAREYGIC